MTGFKLYIKVASWLAAFSLCLFLLLKLLSREHQPSPREGGLKQLATEINKHAPRFIDSLIRLDYVHVLNDSTVQYYHTLKTMDRTNIDPVRFEKKIRSFITDSAAHAGDISYYRENGVTIECRYVDKNKDPVCVVIVRPADFRSVRE